MSIIFYNNEQQQHTATSFIAEKQSECERKIYTQILPIDVFYPAEDYHQKYYLRQEPVIFRDFISLYPTVEDFISSTAAARVNGYIGGHGTLETLQEQIDQFGLSSEGKAKLLQLGQRLPS